MRQKPGHLAPEFAGQFADPSVVAAYHLRPPYPPQVIDHLLSLRVDADRVLDAGTGTGEIARALVQLGSASMPWTLPQRCWHVAGNSPAETIRS